MRDKLPQLASQVRLDEAEERYEVVEVQFFLSSIVVAFDLLGASFALIACWAFEEATKRITASPEALSFIIASIIGSTLLMIVTGAAMRKTQSLLVKRLAYLPAIAAVLLLLGVAHSCLFLEFWTGTSAGVFWTSVHVALCWLLCWLMLRVWMQHKRVKQCQAAKEAELEDLIDSLCRSNAER